MKQDITKKIFLAPMLEPNDIAFRLLCKKAGCTLTFTGMTSPLTKHKQQLDDKPAMQIFSNSTKGIKEFIKKYDKKVSMWDFNLGCPSKQSQKLKHGAFLNKDTEKIKQILKTIRQSTKKPCSIKLRKTPQTLKIAKIAQDLNFNFIIIHPRTIKQGYSGEPDYEFAKKLKKALKIPLIYSGNTNKNNIKKILNDFDYLMIGRQAIGRPQIFSEITNKKCNISFKAYLKLAKKYKLSFRQIKFQAMNFTKEQKNAKKLREQIIKCKDIKDIEDVFLII